MTDYHSMSDNELCERISAKREPKPKTSLEQWTSTDRSPLQCWILQPFTDDETAESMYKPINWLSGENAITLLEEMAESFEIRLTKAYYAESYYCDLYALEGAAEDKLVLKCEISQSPTLPRAICEAWLSVNP